MKLLPRYATVCGLDIGDQHLLEQFYPLPDNISKYITLQGSSGMAAKNYAWWGETVALIKPYLESIGISIIQLGGEKDTPVPGTINLLGKTNFHQTNYIVTRALAHMGNDSWISHRAGFLQKSLTEVFGATSVENHSPYVYDEKASTFISSHRNGKNPSFQSQEPSPSINLIPPEQVAKAVLKNLGLIDNITIKSLFFGPAYQQPVPFIEFIPTTTELPKETPLVPLHIRMDLDFQENNLAQLLNAGIKCVVITDRPINPQLLTQFKSNILAFNYEIIDSFQPSPQYIKFVKATIPSNAWFTKNIDEENLKRLRLQYFDICFVEKYSELTRQQGLEGIANFLNKKVLDLDVNLGKMKVKSNKFIVKEGKIFISQEHLNQNLSIPSYAENSGDVIDTQLFWKDLNNYYLYEN